MKTTFAVLVGLIAIATSCKKDSVLLGNRWRFKGKVYETKISYVDPKSGLSSANCLLASSYPTGTGEPFCTIDVNFQNLPITSGTYNIVNAHDALGPDDISIGIVINDNLTFPEYLSIGSDHKTATVSISNGLAHVSVASCRLALDRLVSPGSTLALPDTADIEINLYQTR